MMAQRVVVGVAKRRSETSLPCPHWSCPLAEDVERAEEERFHFGERPENLWAEAAEQTIEAAVVESRCTAAVGTAAAAAVVGEVVAVEDILLLEAETRLQGIPYIVAVVVFDRSSVARRIGRVPERAVAAAGHTAVDRGGRCCRRPGKSSSSRT